MSVLLVLVPVSLSLATLFVTVCLLSIRSGQFDDLESPRWRMLFDTGDAVKAGNGGLAVSPADTPPITIPSESTT